MKLDVNITARDLNDVGPLAREAEEMGFDGLWSSETQHDPFLPLAVAATTTRRVLLGTAISVVFPRSPAIFAHIAWDLHQASKGRFVLGLGTQVKGHNERRFSVKWESPGPKLRDAIRGIRAIWDCWQNGTPLNYRGEFYQFTLMTPFFNPGPIDYPPPAVYIAAVNAYNCKLVGELCDGIHIHPFHSLRYIQETVLPNINEGLAKSGRTRADVTLAAPTFIITGRDQAEMETAKASVKQQIAFYASTRTYEPVLAAHGWQDLTPKLYRKSVAQDWAGMADLITDEMLDVYAVTGGLDEIAAKVRAKYEGHVDRINPYITWEARGDRAVLKQIARAFQR